ncbi:SDR family NAD(P)-dependent oxidoreductase [Paenibacillus sp. UNC499MF]|uniref:SDR family oxidoreductase n=1 Tax=Paenibacillus sp. UNC499MF TaxID=1502751 RepID=UPI0008A05E80|nr:SDR family NAD(P)-dependent oxidoreductase [Paenibacillus sp. UNC499MF]SEG14310.1 NAD(P)-dependent dehydrogenase, short-chain alcohol dehydrogenase family [Paenibacillus sp. UNC499MF]
MEQTNGVHTGDYGLAGKTALITGASSGIGKAASLRLAKLGVKVCLVDISKEHAEDVQEIIMRKGGEAIVAEADISDPEQVKTAFGKVRDTWGRLDIVLANAGINGKIAPIEDLEPEEWDATLQTNLKGTFLTVKHAIPLLKENGGSIVITSSINGTRIFKNFGFTAYSSSKAGQVAFAKMAALELARYKIRVNVICPGSINTNIEDSTERTPELEEIRIPVEYPETSMPLADRPGTPEQVADLLVFLGSDLSSHVTGTEVYIDGAESLL